MTGSFADGGVNAEADGRGETGHKGRRRAAARPARRAGAGRVAGPDDHARRPSYAGHRFPAEIIGHAVWLYFCSPLSLRHVGGSLAARGVAVGHGTVRRWALKFGQTFANRIRRRLPRAGDKWHPDEVEAKIACGKHWIRRPPNACSANR